MHMSLLSPMNCNDNDKGVFFSLQSLMNTNKEDMRELAAQLYAVVISTMTGNELQAAVQNLVKITKDSHVRFFSLTYISNQPRLSQV